MMNNQHRLCVYELSYGHLVSRLINEGQCRPSRAGITRSLVGQSLVVNSLYYREFPILTSRQIFYKPVLGELAAFLKGSQRLQDFKDQGCNYWDANAAAWSRNKGLPTEKQTVGKVYGAQWRGWGLRTHDQLRALIEGIKADTYGRRHIVTAWNPDDLPNQCLPPCHIMFQCYVTTDGHIDMVVTMRSVDVILGLPSDVVLYAVLLILICGELNYLPGTMIFNFGDAHIYENHVETFLEKQASRFKSSCTAPSWGLSYDASLDTFEPSHLELVSYKHQGPIKYEFNV